MKRPKSVFLRSKRELSLKPLPRPSKKRRRKRKLRTVSKRSQ